MASETTAFQARLRAARLVPILRLATAEAAGHAARWLVEAGLPVIELTLTTPGTLELVAALKSGAPATDAPMIGVGTVLTLADARNAISAGADFLVTPCYVSEVAALARGGRKPLIMGAATPSEILVAHREGAEIIKLFPAASLGGPAFLKQVRAVFPSLAFLPTGGVSPDTAADYLKVGAIAVGLGSELAPAALIEAGDKAAVMARIATIRQRVAEAL